MDITALFQICNIIIAPSIAHGIIDVESKGDPYAINVNAPNFAITKHADKAEAVAYAENLIRLGFSIDMGLAQINSKNLESLNLTVSEVFEPCNNLTAMQKVFLRGYDMRGDKGMSAKEKKVAALSRYNTGDKAKGVANGYVDKIMASIDDEVIIKEDVGRVVEVATVDIVIDSERGSNNYIPDGFTK